MNDLHFTDEAIAGLFSQSALMIIIPVILLIVWKVKTHEKIFPVIVGAATWLLFAIILKLAPAYFLLQADNPAAKTISGNIWLTMLTAGILAGVFEETGRFIAFRTVLKKYKDRRTSLSYGIGHGGFESIYIGMQMLMFPVIGIMVNSGMGDQLTAGMDETAKAAMLAQTEPLSQSTFAYCMLGVYERIPAIAFHISASVLVFAAAREKKYAFLYPLMIFVHAVFDFMIVFYSAGIVPSWAIELMFTAFAAAAAYFALKVYRILERN